MALDSKDEIASYLKNHLYANLATVNAGDSSQPHVSSVAYVSDGLDLYFMTSAQTQKVINIEKDPKVALTVDEDEADWSKLTGLQIEGDAEIVAADRMESLLKMLVAKFPAAKAIPQSPDIRFVKITPRKIWVLDYRKGFGHREYVEVEASAPVR